MKLSEELERIADGMDRPHDVPRRLVDRARELEAEVERLHDAMAVARRHATRAEAMLEYALGDDAG